MHKCIELLSYDWLIRNLLLEAVEWVILTKWLSWQSWNKDNRDSIQTHHTLCLILHKYLFLFSYEGIGINTFDDSVLRGLIKYE